MSSTPLRILIVEDSEDDADLLVRELQRGGFDVSHLRVDSGPSLLSALEARAWDIIVSDYSMPGFSGTEALKIVRNRTSEIPFLFISGTLGEETAVAALKSGAQDYLVKGKLTRLVPAIQRELREAHSKREREKLETQLHHLRRFEAIGRLAGGIAHDFNNVIGAILGWAEIGCNELPQDSKTRDRLEKIQNQAHRASGLTRQLLAFARRQVLQPQNLDVNTLAKETVSLLGKIIGAQIQIDLVLAPNLDSAWADSTQIEQVLMNLCLNARDAMPRGGSIRIQTKMAHLRPGDSALRSDSQAGDYVMLIISDTGTGMDAETLDHIFEPFFTTKEVGKGTGLGLATVYGIVKQHDGIIEVDSKPDVGTTFRIYLPVGSGMAQAPAKKAEGAVKGGTETVLIAEDHEGLREAAQEMLEALGYHILLATTGAEAVKIFEKDFDKIDIVLLDVVMPTMDGPRAFEKMAAIKPHLRAIFTTGYTTEVESLAALVGREVQVLHKPYSSKELGQKVRSLLDQPA
jgi:two-component system, cell cycle sensor histidine kinase and response regulator CckA